MLDKERLHHQVQLTGQVYKLLQGEDFQAIVDIASLMIVYAIDNAYEPHQREEILQKIINDIREDWEGPPEWMAKEASRLMEEFKKDKREN